MTTYDRPVEAKLFVVLDNGEKFEAKKEDLKKFGYVKSLDAYMNFNNHIDKILRNAGLIEDGEDLTSTMINPLRYIAELSCVMPELLNHPEHEDVHEAIIQLEKTLRKAKEAQEAANEE